MNKLLPLKKQTFLVLLLWHTAANLWAAIPTITSFSPTSGAVGTTVTITGINFNATPANNIVFFGAVKATVTTATSTSLSVQVPVGATYQPISVSDITTGLTAYSAQPFITTFAGSNAFDANSFAGKADNVTGNSPTSVAVGDLDGDGKPDLAVTNYGSNTVSVFRNTGSVGTVSFLPKIDYATGRSPQCVSIGDLDGDGKPDLAVANLGGSNVSVFRNIGSVGTVSFAPKVDYPTGSYPWSVSIGDLDGDGKPDLAVANNNSNTVSVLCNTSSIGTISFAIKVDYATGIWPQDISIGDLDGDGKPDLAVANSGSNTVSLLRNASSIGNVSFAAKVDYATGSRPYSVSIGDVDGDGKPDLAIANFESNTVSILRNTSSIGTVMFVAKVDYATGSYPWSVSIGDLDGDGKPDLAVINLLSNDVSVFRNTANIGTVSFDSKVDYETGYIPKSVSMGDMDGDGKPDLVVVNEGFKTISVLRSSVLPAPTIGSFTPTMATSGGVISISGTNFTSASIVKFESVVAHSVSYVSPTNITAVVGAGLTGNLSVTIPGGGSASITGFIYIIPPVPSITSFTPTSNATGSIGGMVTITGTNFIGATSVSFGGIAAVSFTVVSATSLKAVVGIGATGEVSVSTLGGTTTLSGFTFIPAPTITSFNPPMSQTGTTVTITGTNFNATPVNNIVFFGAVKATVTAATSTSLSVQVPVGTTYQSISVTDFTTGLTAYSAQPFITTFAGSNAFDAKSFAPLKNYTSGSYPYSVSIGDLDGDGKPDLVVANWYSSNVSVFRNTGNTGSVSFATKVDYSTGILPQSVCIGDLDGDGKPDLVVANMGSSTVSVLHNTSSIGTILFANKVDCVSGSDPYSVSIGDMDGDGKPDLTVANYSSNSVSVFRNTGSLGTVSFTTKVDFETGDYPSSVCIGDLDGDGKPDVATANLGSNNVSVLRNTSNPGTVSFAAKVDYSTGRGPQSVSIGDLDGDGKPDLAAANWGSTNVSVLRNTGSIGAVSFADKIDYATGSYPQSVFISDLNGDGKPDLAVANFNSETVSILRNIGNPGTVSFTAKVDYSTGSGPQSVSIGDVDGDGKPDLVVANRIFSDVSVLRNTVFPAPTIASFSPISAATGTTVTITGTDFTGATAVSFGSTAAKSFNVASATSITAIVAAGTTGDVTVTTPGGTATLAGFTFIPAPTITSFTPTSAATGASVTITGTSFTEATAVSFGGTAASSFTVVSATSITAVVATGTTGDVSVTTPGGITTLVGFMFIPPPVITVLNPSSAATGSTVTITGTGFTGATAVSFGDTAAKSFTVVSETSITAVIGSGSSGVVSVTTPGGTDTMQGFTLLATDINDATSERFVVYPNPATDYLVIKGVDQKLIMVKVFDVNGRLLIDTKAENGQLNIQGLALGIYNLKVNNIEYKLIKQ